MTTPEDVPAEVSVVCSRCQQPYPLPDAVINHDVMANVIYPEGRSWFPMCPDCSEFYRERAGVPSGG